MSFVYNTNTHTHTQRQQTVHSVYIMNNFVMHTHKGRERERGDAVRHMQSRLAQQTITPFNFYHGAGQIYINITQAATATTTTTTSLDSGAALQIGSL